MVNLNSVEHDIMIIYQAYLIYLFMYGKSDECEIKYMF